MSSLFALLLVGYLGGLSGRTAWIFFSSSLVFFCAPIYLIGYMGVANPIWIISWTIPAIAFVQFGSLVGLLKSRAGDEL